MRIETSPRLQAIADTRDADSIQQASVTNYTFDVNDGDDCSELFEDGLKTGFKLATTYRRERKAHGDKVKLFKVTFPEYVDDDGKAWFIGTEDQIATVLESLPAD